MKVRIAIQRSPQETRKQYSAHCDGGMAGIALSAATPTQGPEGSNHKPKRVRTGCLTCRQRHLKCDESYPDCVNCRKSSRKCQRGVRLNFIDTTVHRTPILSAHENWSIKFQDESREIASEYRGGLAQYPSAEARSPARREDQVPLTPIDQGPTSTIVHRPLLPFESHAANQYIEDSLDDTYNAPSIANSTISTSSTTYPTYSLSTTPNTPYRSSEPLSPPGLEGCTYLDNQEEVLFLQVFVEEVGLWMDSMDPMKHVW